jgi:hypothetical protein
MVALGWWDDAAVVAEARPEGRAGAAIAACAPLSRGSRLSVVSSTAMSAAAGQLPRRDISRPA